VLHTAYLTWMHNAGVVLNHKNLQKLEGLDLNDDHWAVIAFLRSHYLWNGDQLNDAQISEALNQYFLSWVVKNTWTSYSMEKQSLRGSVWQISIPPKPCRFNLLNTEITGPPIKLTKDNLMSQTKNNALFTSGSSYESIDRRLTELNNQHWNREKSEKLANKEGLTLNNEHWNVIQYLRSYYLEFGLPRFARTTARSLNQQFAEQGGSKYLRRLFNEGPVSQGSRLANLIIPDNAFDASFGTNY
jgi:tRNA 2-thiouridine synthesizing protein E